MRIFMGIVWFVVFFLVLYIAFSIITSVIMFRGVDVVDTQALTSAAFDFARNHAMALSVCRWNIFVVSVVLAVLGTWKRVLPGTNKKKESAAS
ncbi:MAG: hypothetical protein ACRETO_05405 [Gammaproteobacteria bacterium]